MARGNYQEVSKILQEGEDPNQLDPFNKPLIYTAIMTSDPGLVHLLLQYGADPNAPGKNTTPLLSVASMINSFDGRYENLISIAFLLIDYGADIDYRNSEGRRAVNRAREGILQDFLKYIDRARDSMNPRSAPLPHATPNPIVRFSQNSRTARRAKSTAKKSAVKKTALLKSATKKSATKKSATKKTVVKKSAARKSSAKKSATKRKPSARRTRKMNSPQNNNGSQYIDPSLLPFIERNENYRSIEPYVPTFNPENNRHINIQAPMPSRARGIIPRVVKE